MKLKTQLKESADSIDEKEATARKLMDDRGIMSEVRMIGGAMITILIIALVLTEVHDAVAVSEGPFAEIVTDLETTGVAALSLLVVGLLVVAAVAIMRFFGGGFGASR